MKIVQINAYYGYGSTGNIVKEIEKKGLESGLEMYSIYWLLRNSSIESNKVKFCGRKTQKSSISKMAHWIFQGGKITYNTEITQNILETIKQINPDIIHLHNLHGDFEYGMLDIPLFMKAVASMNKKVVWTFHDCWPVTGRCYYFSYKNCERWRTGCGNCPQRFYDREGIFYDITRENWINKNQLYSEIKDLLIVTVSNWLEQVVKQSMLSDRKVVTIFNGINLDVFSPEKIENKKIYNSKRKFTILCIGWDRRKGYKDYYKLSKMLADDEEILVVGKRPIFRALKKLPSNIRTIPNIKDVYEMAKIYREADIYFNSSCAETFGLTTAEAIACGTPVIGYNSTATPELIGNKGDCGCTVTAGNVEKVYEAINMIRKQKNRDGSITKMKRHERAACMFGEDRMTDEYIEVYRLK